MLELQYAKFVNFKPFKINMNLTELELHIPRGSDIIIINGENGSGKTTMMRALSPFGKPDGGSDIIDGVDGYKVLRYIDTSNGVIYEINHVYTANKNGHSVQSHIMQINTDGSQEALNPNGNVGSFNDVLDRVFNINSKTRKLLNLSLDDKGLINLTTAERRNYVYSILPDMEEIDQHSKNVLVKYRVVNKEMEATKLKLSKYPDLEKMKLDLADNESRLDKLNANLIEIAERIGEFIAMEKQYQSYKERHDALKEKIYEYNDAIQVWTAMNDKYKSADKNVSIESIISNLIEEKVECETSIQILKNDNLELVSSVVSLNESLEDADNVMTALDEIKILRKNIEEYKDWASISIPYTIDNFREVEPYFSEITDVVGKALENVSDKQVFLDGVINLIDFSEEVIKLENELHRASTKQTQLYTTLRSKRDSIAEYANLGDSSTAECRCPIKNFIDGKINAVGDLDVLDNELKECDVLIVQLSDSLTEMRIMANEQINIRNAKFRLSIIQDNTIARKLLVEFDEILWSGSLESKFEEFKLMKDERAKYETYQMISNRLKELASFEKVTGIKSKEDIELQIEALKLKIETNENLLANAVRSQSEINLVLKIIQTTPGSCRKLSIKEIHRNKHDTERQEKELLTVLTELDNSLEVKRQLDKDRQSIDNELVGYKNRIMSLNNNINMVETLETDYQSLLLEERELGMVKDILRIKLPLKIMQHFLNVVKESANDFLINVGSKYKVSEFKLTDNEFIIEVINGTYLNEDVSTMSSGEKSIVSLALTFGMQNAILGKYKIMNLDEVDAPLDYENRKRYLDILFRQSHNYGIGQIFIVTHNDNFNDHAERISVIALKGAHVRDDARIIYKYS